MALRNRYLSLIARHRQIEKSLRWEVRRPLPDDLEIQRLKRLKLFLKDRIASMEKRYPSRPAPGRALV